MDRQAQIDRILDHYENPRHYGSLGEPMALAQGGNPGCGDVVTVYLRVDGEERISDISFEGEGCTISQAGASLVTELCGGKTLTEVEAMSGEVILDLLGRELAATRLKCATLGLNTTKDAVKRWRSRTT